MSDKASILLVDDRPEKLLALEAVLEDLGQTIVRAYSGREALRQVLQQDFAVILLDVNMPGMDGFETAQLIRQRKSSEHVPIIFVTAFGDDLHAARGYQLGAVDYIQAPVVPEVLRTKVAVFVDLFRKTEQVKRQADSLRQRAGQLQRLAAASVAINGALSVDRMLQTITDSAREVVGAHQAITLFVGDPSATAGPPHPTVASAFSDKYAAWRNRPLRIDAVTHTIVATSRRATRMTEQELHEHPDWELVRRLDLPPVKGGMLAAPLTGRDGANLGVVYLADKELGHFTHDDEAVLVQLAQMGSVAIENTLYSQEREANRIKDEFLATLSHELRTPLNAILGWTQLLRSEELSGDVARGLEVIDRNARSQTKLIEDLLDVSRITSGKLRLSVRQVRLGEVVAAAVDAVRPAAEAKKVSIVIPGGGDDDRVSGDPDRLQQVVWNLLSNAVKFTGPGGRVSVTTGRAADRVVVAVTDDGQGIDPKFLPHVFDRFRQADSTSTRSHGGLGIGLTIARHILELHGGTIRADSPGLGRGSTFTIEVPAATATAAPAAAASGDGAYGADGADGANGHANGKPAAVAEVISRIGPAEVPPDPADADGAAVLRRTDRLAGVTVLLVDDEPDARDVVAQILRRADATVVAAASAVEGLERLRAGPVDVLLSDIAMPGMDGYQLIAAVRADDAPPVRDVPAIALTAYAREDDRARCLRAGFNVHLPKPIDPGQLVASIARLAHARPAAPAVTAEA